MTIYYTRKGDKGETSAMGGKKFPKDDVLMHAVGDVDELNSQIGVSLFYVREDDVREVLKMIQNDLFSIGAILASSGRANLTKAKITKKSVQMLEKAIDSMDAKLPQLRKFVLPAGSEESSHLHLARSVARRAERSVFAASKKHKAPQEVLSYLNRLSSYLFTAALYLNFRNGVEESNPMY
ncbi:MAG: cob(I)yrinic acid a,c-diamide adenosyltransferase [Candidatus Micrarchaeota archaeon]|nr:cob(I)yrinic acid a,c-diamide adenosyltransferase [Candidatus Micrarchaeota archaeon]MDE1804284.1 cob(I)yrinic acid a,c-diamide adenosyltransferase [Candidatus Micrarchaeota archaeon]MDE1846849.1 cob(I)yrinic acid a,c-diamide adenosyltransferase [Candidatus Micrarchaeota archaeon]